MDILLEQGWSEIDSKLVKEYLFPNFAEAINFINLIADESEKMNHHPDIKLYKYRNVSIMLTTHSRRRITKNDIALAKKIDDVYDNLQII